MNAVTPVMRKRLPQHWYRYWWGECPVCGRDKSFKERVYGLKPDDIKERHKWQDPAITYDHCLE